MLFAALNYPAVVGVTYDPNRIILRISLMPYSF
jgi:hypothetical protein